MVTDNDEFVTGRVAHIGGKKTGMHVAQTGFALVLPTMLQRDSMKIDYLLPGLGQQSDIDPIPGRGRLSIQGPTNK